MFPNDSYIGNQVYYHYERPLLTLLTNNIKWKINWSTTPSKNKLLIIRRFNTFNKRDQF